ncbi:MAG TPA: hypothetical protein VFV34_19895, partial [Blastocatellia bacterium]|nr:hypothetical protein [Blastocatellia bacterium]
PDSQHLGFFAGRKLRKIEVPDGRAVDLCDVGVGTGGAWGRDGVILFASLGAAGVSRVSDTGGAVTSVIRADLKRLETDYKDPSFLPDGRHFLYFNSSGEKEIRGVYVASLDGRVNKRLLGDDSNAVYASSGSGREYLLFGREGALMAQPFDTRQLRFTDEPFSVAGQVGRVLSTHARRNFSVSENGVLVLDSLPDRQRNQLIWVDRAGRKTNDVGGPQTLNPGRPRLSPDDARFIEDRFDLDRGSSDLWLTDVASGNVRPFTFDLATDLDAVWSPDGSRIAWCSNRAGQFDLYRRAASGEGKDELLHKGQDYPKHPTDWSRDGRFIIYGQPHPKTKGDVWVLPVGPPVGEPFVFLHSEANEGAAVLSPNGAWMAYQSDESGQYEVYVQSFPEGGGKRQISTGGGLAPHWRADGKEMFYHAPDGNLMAVTVKRGPSFEAARPLFPFRPAGTRFLPFYSVSGDGQRFLLSTIVDNDMTTPLTVMVNWSADLKR